MDEAILKALNAVVGHPGQIDTALILIASNPLFKGVPVMMLVWALWTRPAPHRAQLRARLAAALAAGVLAIALGRALSMLLPYRPRPIHDPEILETEKADYIFILPWNLTDEITKQLVHLADRGTKFVRPVPGLMVLEG